MKLQHPMDRSSVFPSGRVPFPRTVNVHLFPAGGSSPSYSLRLFAAALCAAVILGGGVSNARAQVIAAAKPADALMAATSMNVTLGKSALLRMPAPVARLSVGNPEVADMMLISPTEIYVLGKTIGTTNIILWTKDGSTVVIDVTVLMDAAALQSKLQELMPDEKNIRVSAAGDSLAISGTISDTLKADRAMALADAYVRASAGTQGGTQRAGAQGGGQGGESQGAGQGLGSIQVINLLQVGSNQQVMLEVKIVEINRTVAEKLGFDFQRATRKAGSAFTQIMTGIVGGAPGQLFQSLGTPSTGDSFLIDAERKDELIQILAEPNIVAISGQEASFLVGGEVMIPVPQFAGVVTLQSRQFGVGLKFTPTVLEEGRINLVVSPEVTELVSFNTIATTGLGGVLAVPTFTTRRISTTVQLREGQSLAIGGLLQDNIKEHVRRFPILGELPVLGALFRSSDFQKDKTELMIVVTPHLIKPLEPVYKLPTDAFTRPTRSEFLLEGKMEGSPEELPAKEIPGSTAQPPAEPLPNPADAGGFQMR
ncbi:MAG: type II and III secretion system protein family protein [Nitrosospira sp.]|nr:type II and III secretion system protein family protein [Nitrosospira sp.]